MGRKQIANGCVNKTWASETEDYGGNLKLLVDNLTFNIYCTIKMNESHVDIFDGVDL